ncbi:hypothetical protein M3202_13845 [Alkalihalobacillus oceani]|uniref:Uncharacterized protein n=1 Tax=Halalkalibacter oceani TaxID=1653776 RepID=A0A9X2DTF1_9BACI|nr:hypothetical protein [Halalkalibacter oceani]MCM3715167.1 hypothetical protein [Halalkalibacter oceani]
MKMKVTYGIIMLFCCLVFAAKGVAAEKIYFYIDGQEQRYQGEVVEEAGSLLVPLRPILMNLHFIDDEWAFTSREINEFLREKRSGQQETRSGQGEDEEQEMNPLEAVPLLRDLPFVEKNNREMIRLEDVIRLGFDGYYYQNDDILQVNTPAFMEIAGLVVGDSRQKVSGLYPDVHWNTGFGQAAELNGFIGEMVPYTYKDRYGYERTEEVPELQVEIQDDRVSYLFVSSDRFPTSKGVQVGDELRDVYRLYGNQYVRDRMDGKQIIVYDVENGSIWFIADQDQVIERIAYWDHHLRGFGEQQAELLPEDEEEEKK